MTVGITSKVNLSERVGEIESRGVITERGMASNSIVSRMLIWDTAWQAIKAHPVVGIGFYSFPFNSKYYYTIPRILFNNYVHRRTPHVGYLAVLTETGIIGLLTFLILVYIILFLIFKAADLAKEKDEIFFSQILLWCLVYITYSLFLTDAWLWGSGIMVWGMFLGLGTANYKNLIKKLNAH